LLTQTSKGSSTKNSTRRTKRNRKSSQTSTTSVTFESQVNEIEKQNLKKWFDSQKANERVGLQAFLKLPSIASSPINDFIVAALDKELSGRRITYNEFLGYLSVLHRLCPTEVKHDFLFSMLDRGQKGYVNAADILSLMTRLARETQPNKADLSETQVQRIQNFVKQTLQTFDSTNQSQLIQEDFIRSLQEKEIGRLFDLTSLNFVWTEQSEKE